MARKSDATDNTVKLNVARPPSPKVPKTANAPKVKLAGSDGATKAVKVEGGEMIKKPDFLDRALERTSVKKSEAKPAIEAALATLADILKDGGEVQLPPLGKLKVVKSRDIGDGAEVLTLKLRTMKTGTGPQT